ncbi:hypothetical protein [Paenibacillus roseipurpureus]|uniref:Uncharacterized protein n=1 Tax=Paenibacillus roseopurpureus TaxID=2918901 RepID=A0AA96RJK0_9BACL|nr:hypothetical protein [Paenibacillus sp. MBLB1832]WNR43865.1 hypothetical protein MJB10_22650 [Paenibacillus sp. MBLB1832]
MPQCSRAWLRKMREKHRRMNMNSYYSEKYLQMIGKKSQKQSKEQNHSGVNHLTMVREGASAYQLQHEVKKSEVIQRDRKHESKKREVKSREFAKVAKKSEVNSREPIKSKGNVLPFASSKQRMTAAPSPAERESAFWELRKQSILRLAHRRNGKVRLLDVAAECNVHIQIAAEWLIRLTTEGILSLVASHRRHARIYVVNNAGGDGTS